jgi:hypothetical protein
MTFTGPTTDLPAEIAAVIRERTGGRLTHLRVTVEGSVVNVSGMAPSFYLKQLALEAVRAALRGLPLRTELEITVHAR